MEYSEEEKLKTSVLQSTKVTTEFLWDGAMFVLRINDDHLQLECIKSGKLLSLSSRNASVELHRIIATSCKRGQWMVDKMKRPILHRSFFDFLQFRSTQCFILTIHFWDKLPDGRRKCRVMDLCTDDEEHCKEWQKNIQLLVRDIWKKNGQIRPRSLLIFINPYGGKKKGEKIYQEVVSPLFKIAGIKETVIVTKHEGQAKDYLTSNDILSHDGVIAMGGDGTFNEISNGVLQSTQQKHRVRLDRENGEPFYKEMHFEKPNIKLGVIPVGTANMLCCTTMEVIDPETATLQIIAGESQPLDVCSMHNEDGKFVTFFFLASSYGVTEKVLTMSEKYRHFGLFRYELSTLNAILEFSSSSCEITYLPGSNKTSKDIQTDITTCRNPCLVCLKTTRAPQDVTRLVQPQLPKIPLAAKLNKNEKNNLDLDTISESCKKEATLFGLPDGEEEKFDNESKKCPPDNVSSMEQDWKVTRTSYVAITVLNTACKYKGNTSGFSPSAHLADGTCDLKIINSTSRMEFIRCFRARRTTQGNNDFPCVEFHRVRAFHFQELKRITKATDPSRLESQSNNDKSDDPVSDNKNLWTIDGEVKKSGAGNITVWVHRGLIDMFSTRD